MTGDCPALKIALNFINHNGYYPCYFCHIHGVHRNGKRQYPYESNFEARTIEKFSHDATVASNYQKNVYGHLGVSTFECVLDIPLPQSVIIDYAHATLLRHSKSVFTNLYQRLRPSVRQEVDDALLQQRFPHFFHRRMKAFSDFSFIKATEVRNILLYGFIPIFHRRISCDLFGHFCLFICAIRLLHGFPVFGDRTYVVAEQLMIKYYEDFNRFYENLENFVLHLHYHFVDQCRNFGPLCHTGSFGQESLLGYMSSNFKGSRFHGEQICQNYSLDFFLNHELEAIDLEPSTDDGAFDQDTAFTFDSSDGLFSLVESSSTDATPMAFRRCKIHGNIFHSLQYNKRKNSVSYVVRYRTTNSSTEFCFGNILVFARIGGLTYAFVERYSIQRFASDLLSSSLYYQLLSETIDAFFFVISKHSPKENDWISISEIIDHCILFDCVDYYIATPISSYDEHD